MSDVSDEKGPVQPTAKQRLQATRQALMNELVPSTRASAPRRLQSTRTPFDPSSMTGIDTEEPQLVDADDQYEQGPSARSGNSSGSGWFAVAKHSARAWWEFHPVRVVGVVAEPVLAEYARQRPLKLVGIAAGLGALVVVTRPWRLVSLGSLAVAALKSSQVSNFALTFLSNRKNNRKTPT